jgi:hypothetical protein
VSRRVLLLLLAICIACKPAPKQPAKPGAGPQQAATVLAVRTTAGDTVKNHEIVIANGRARSTGEQDVWRLFDTKAKTVTFVDDIEQTFRTESLDTLINRRQATLAAAIPSSYPRAKLTHGQRKNVLGVSAQQAVIEVGAYRRELWIAEHPSIPDELFAMMLASDAPASPLAPIMQRVDEELLRVRGFPLADKAEIAFGNGKSVVDRAVVGIAPRQVPEAMLAIPRDYRDVTPKPAPAKGQAKTKVK